ncbi:MAG: DUF4870 domain-containing protein [Myxococcales bacterium]|nr:DUF4870 domain-containing protein [Myxococcales bacterium]
MTQPEPPHAWPGAPSPPGPPGPLGALGPPAPTAPTEEERLLGAAAYLMTFIGAWIIGPLVIYFWKGKTSRFVAFHAIQATVVTAWLLALSIGAAVFMWLWMLLFVRIGFDLYLPAVTIGGLLALVPVVLVAVAAWKAFQGKSWAIPIFGRVTRSFLNASSAQPPGGLPQAGAPGTPQAGPPPPPPPQGGGAGGR